MPIGIHLAQFGASLPLWYMPPAMSRGGRRWKTPFVLAIVSAFLLIDALGLCNTYGILSLGLEPLGQPAASSLRVSRLPPSSLSGRR